jgi:hypothetical protein
MKIRCEGHIESMGMMRNAYKILFDKREGCGWEYMRVYPKVSGLS